MKISTILPVTNLNNQSVIEEWVHVHTMNEWMNERHVEWIKERRWP